jgi:hypothetical protein
MTFGEMTNVLPEKTISYKPGDFFSESSDMVEGTEKPALAVHREVARCPDRRGADVTGKHGVVRGELIDHPWRRTEVAALGSPARGGELVQARPRRSVVLERRHDMLVVPRTVEVREQTRAAGKTRLSVMWAM